MKSRIDVEIPSLEQERFWLTALVLANARYDKSFVLKLFEGVMNLRDSTVIQSFLEEGRQEGRQEGRCEEARRVLLQLCKKRLGNPTKKTAKVLDALSDIDEIEDLILRASDAKTWDELLAHD